VAKEYVMKLTAYGRVDLEGLARRGHVAGWKVKKAQALLHEAAISPFCTNVRPAFMTPNGLRRRIGILLEVRPRSS
jgi:hypothetical protein